MNKVVRSKVDEFANGSNEKIRSLVDAPYTWEFKENNEDYQGEVVAVWEDKEKGVIRIIGYATSSNAKWWNRFFSKSSYEKIIVLK